jgi:hypothetical protein
MATKSQAKRGGAGATRAERRLNGGNVETPCVVSPGESEANRAQRFAGGEIEQGLGDGGEREAPVPDAIAPAPPMNRDPGL